MKYTDEILANTKKVVWSGSETSNVTSAAAQTTFRNIYYMVMYLFYAYMKYVYEYYTHWVIEEKTHRWLYTFPAHVLNSPQ